MDGVMHPSVEQAIGRDRIRKAFKRYENNPADEHDRGIVRAVNSDGSYEVLLDGDVQTARCSPYAKAMVGDRVIVVTTKDGENVLLGRLGGEIETIAPTIAERFAELEARLSEAEYDTGWENVYYVSGSMWVKARRVGKQVTVVGKSSGYYELPAGEYRDVTTLPEKFRPSVDIQFVKHNQGGPATADSNYVSPDGRVRMYTAESGNRYWGFSVSYPVD